LFDKIFSPFCNRKNILKFSFTLLILAGTILSPVYDLQTGSNVQESSDSQLPIILRLYPNALTTLSPRNPVLNSINFGSTDDESGVALALDSENNILITGYTGSQDFPTFNAYQSTFGGGLIDGFLMKLSPDGNQVLWSTFLGGTSQEIVWDIEIASDNSIYLTGWTSSTNFPLINPIQNSLAGAWDIFISKFSENGVLLWSTYLGGSSGDEAIDIELNEEKNEIVITGTTSSADFPVKNAFQPNKTGNEDAFVVSLNLSSINFSTFLGGSFTDQAWGLKITTAGDIIVTGITTSFDFPIRGPILSTLNGLSDIFLIKLKSNGSMLWSRFFGTPGIEKVSNIELIEFESIYLTGTTNSTNLPNLLHIYGDVDQESIFISQFSSSGAIENSIIIGSQGIDRSYAMTIDTRSNIFLIGQTDSKNFPLLRAHQIDYGGGSSDIILLKLNQELDLEFSTYLGGNSLDQAFDIQLSNQETLIITGLTASSDYPLRNSQYFGKTDIFLTFFGDLSDEDRDGIPNWWEFQHGLNPLDQSDANSDLDLDGLPNLFEFENGLNASNPLDALEDYDNDDLPTYWEYQMQLDPFHNFDKNSDPDNDGLSNYWEYLYQLNATDSKDALYDLDGDSLTNIQEFLLGTNPRIWDTDQDGFDDGIETVFDGLLGDPLNPNDNPASRLVFLALLVGVISLISSLLYYSIKKYMATKKRIFQEQLTQGEIMLNNLVELFTDISENMIAFKENLEPTSDAKVLKERLNLMKSFINPLQNLQIKYQDIEVYRQLIPLQTTFSQLDTLNQSATLLYSELEKSLTLTFNQIQVSSDKNLVQEYSCYSCGAITTSHEFKCVDCGMDAIICNICKSSVKFGEEMGTCIFCTNTYHYGHFAEWVKIKGACPVCHETLTQDEIIPHQIGKAKKLN